MKSLIVAAAVLVVLVIVQGCAATKSGPATPPPAQSAVAQLFAAMEAGQYHGGDFPNEFPKLTWSDIPALLQHADSTRTLTTFPVNALSSERQGNCSEGMVALWLVDGIRKTPKPVFPSLNALALPRGPLQSTDWGAISEQNHATVAAAYRKWWAEAGSVSQEKGRQTDPLQGTSLYWY